MDKQSKKLFRCAIYTRKSTEHNLDLEFNSLDAQREACEAYIKSQAHEGWRLSPGRHDDGAFSGASLERPALQKLLGEVQAEKIDIIVVYKADRLTRSLADFAKLVELFDRHGVSFVSVTQSFNTTSSMGRLTLNVLLSFAQFEREVIGERVRDKIAASKAKGIWVGGPIPLGYASVKKKLVVLPAQADTVRTIFRRYFELGSIRALAEDLDHGGFRTKLQEISNGRVRGGIRFGVGYLAQILRNRFYIGDVVYRGKVHRGEHDAIVDQDLFQAVQAKLADGAVARRLKLRASPAILMGRIYDDRGNRMTPSHANKNGARYRYYISHALLQKRTDEVGRVPRVPAPEVERLVVNALRQLPSPADDRCPPVSADERDLVEQHLDRVVIRPNAIEIHLRRTSDDEDHTGQPTDNDHAPATITVPWIGTAPSAAKGILHAPSTNRAMNSATRDALLATIGKARGWIDDLVKGRVSSFAEIARREGKVERHIRFLAPLAFVSPQLITAIIDGAAPADIAATEIAKSLPYSWVEQRRRLGLPHD
ncbi:MAG: recombinase family protein [Alphaproteobacteria bacterium]|nr:recombinase family protein [Alphaproteobacteria bacterium]